MHVIMWCLKAVGRAWVLLNHIWKNNHIKSLKSHHFNYSKWHKSHLAQAGAVSWLIHFIPCSEVPGVADGWGLCSLMLFMGSRYCTHASSLHYLWLWSMASSWNKLDYWLYKSNSGDCITPLKRRGGQWSPHNQRIVCMHMFITSHICMYKCTVESLWKTFWINCALDKDVSTISCLHAAINHDTLS